MVIHEEVEDGIKCPICNNRSVLSVWDMDIDIYELEIAQLKKDGKEYICQVCYNEW
jgi:hypothetical protein